MWHYMCLDQNDWKIMIVRVTQTSYDNPSIQTHLIWKKDSTRRCREGILGLNEDEVAQGGDGTSDGLAVESDLGRKLRAHPVRGRQRRHESLGRRQDEEEGNGYSAEGRHLGASIVADAL